MTARTGSFNLITMIPTLYKVQAYENNFNVIGSD